MRTAIPVDMPLAKIWYHEARGVRNVVDTILLFGAHGTFSQFPRWNGTKASTGVASGSVANEGCGGPAEVIANTRATRHLQASLDECAAGGDVNVGPSGCQF